MGYEFFPYILNIYIVYHMMNKQITILLKIEYYTVAKCVFKDVLRYAGRLIIYT